MSTLSAVIFDFDGLVLDTETAILDAWAAEYERHGVEFPAEELVRANTGTIRGQGGYIDEYELLEDLVGGPVDREAIQQRRLAMHDEILADRSPNPGVREWLEAARTAGIMCGVASSSPREWVEGHLERLGLMRWFHQVSTRSDVGEVAKPDPAVYRHALSGLGVGAEEAAALEDSPAGVASAKGAGLFTVAVPSEITRPLDFSAADIVVDSLVAFTLDDLLARRASRP